MDKAHPEFTSRQLIAGAPAVSPLGWGMWRYQDDNVDAATARSMAALEAGITLFDTADIYGFDGKGNFGAAEVLFGRVLAANPGLRHRIVLATKGGIRVPIPYIARGDYLVTACEDSLRRLGVDCIDLYQVHRPDMLAHPAEIASALDKLRQSGKIREVGVSNYMPAQVSALIAHLPFKLLSIQPEFSPLYVNPLFDGILDQALERNLTVLTWSPLAGGHLLQDDGDARSRAVIAILDRIAEQQQVDRAAIAYAWAMAHPSRPIPLVGSQNPDRIRSAATALRVRLSGQQWYEILVAARGAPMP